MQGLFSSESKVAPPKLNKLRSSQQYRAVYERGTKFHTPYFSLFVCPTNEDAPRIGMTVTRKIGPAVVRNRCKRRLREIARRHTLSILGGVGCDLVINVKPGLVAADFEEISTAFVRALTRSRDLCAKSLRAG